LGLNIAKQAVNGRHPSDFGTSSMQFVSTQQQMGYTQNQARAQRSRVPTPQGSRPSTPQSSFPQADLAVPSPKRALTLQMRPRSAASSIHSQSHDGDEEEEEEEVESRASSRLGRVSRV
jgi:hypothetical protein